MFIVCCGSQQGNVEQPFNEPDQPTAATEPNEELDIVEIPTQWITINRPPEPLPVVAQGLSFQMSSHALPTGAQRHRPVADVILNAKNDIIMCFPERNHVIRFDFPEYKTQIYGPHSDGGNGAPISHPSKLAYWDSLVWVSNDKDETVVALKDDGSLHTMVYVLDVPEPTAGPNQEFLGSFPEQQKAWVRFDKAGKYQKGYVFYEPLHGEPSDQFRAGHTVIESNWDFHFVNKLGSRLASYQKDGMMTHLFELDLNLLGAVRAEDLATYKDGFLVLLVDQTQKLSYVLALQPLSGDYQLFRTPMFADGMDANDTYLVLFDKQRGAVQTWKWQNVAQSHTP